MYSLYFSESTLFHAFIYSVFEDIQQEIWERVVESFTKKYCYKINIVKVDILKLHYSEVKVLPIQTRIHIFKYSVK